MSAPTFDETQHPRGGGGRFTTKPAGEPDVELSQSAPAEPESDAHRLLRAGLEQTHGEDEAQDAVESMGGYEGWDTNHEVTTVGSALSEALADEEGRPAMAVGLESDSDGIVGGYNVTARFYDAEGSYVTLSSFYDIKDSTTDRQATGEEAANAYADNLYNDYAHLERLGNRLGLSPERPGVGGIDEDAGQQALATAKRQMDAGRVAYETQVAEQVGREIRAAVPDSGGYDLEVHRQGGNYFVSRVVGQDGSTLWDQNDSEHLTAPGVSDESWDMLKSPELSPATAPEGSPLASLQVRW